MKNTNRILYICFALILHCINPIKGYAQKESESEIEMDGVMLSSDLPDEISFGLSMKYNHWLNPYVGFSLGGLISHSKLDNLFYSPTNNNITYGIDDKIYSFNGILGAKFASPVYKKIGLMIDFNFMFEPIPFNVASVDKTISHSDWTYDEKTKNKIVFTHFNPSYAILFSIFYQKKSDKSRARISVGGGVSNHNPHNVYYRAKIDNIRLRNHLTLRPNDLSIVVFIRISGRT